MLPMMLVGLSPSELLLASGRYGFLILHVDLGFVSLITDLRRLAFDMAVLQPHENTKSFHLMHRFSTLAIDRLAALAQRLQLVDMQPLQGGRNAKWQKTLRWVKCMGLLGDVDGVQEFSVG